MKINWILRLKNKATLATLIATIVAFVYQILGIFGVVPSISQNEIVDAAGIFLNILAIIGVITDPTTAGVSDSTLAMSYTEPREDKS